MGSYVWVEDAEQAWLDGEVVESNDDQVKVKCETKTVSTPPSLLLLSINPSVTRYEICLALKLHHENAHTCYVDSSKG